MMIWWQWKYWRVVPYCIAWLFRYFVKSKLRQSQSYYIVFYFSGNHNPMKWKFLYSTFGGLLFYLSWNGWSMFVSHGIIITGKREESRTSNLYRYLEILRIPYLLRSQLAKCIETSTGKSGLQLFFYTASKCKVWINTVAKVRYFW